MAVKVVLRIAFTNHKYVITLQLQEVMLCNGILVLCLKINAAINNVFLSAFISAHNSGQHIGQI